MGHKRELLGVPILLCLLMAATIHAFDLNLPLFHALNTAFRWLPDNVWAHVTLLGDALVVLVLAALLAIRYPALAVAGLLAALVATVSTRVLKLAFAMERPLAVLGEQVHVIGVPLHNYSFPSGHTTAAFVLAGLGLLTLPARWAGVVFLAAMLVGLSRVAVGAHWPADVALGASLGLLAAGVGWHWAAHWRWARSVQAQRLAASLYLLFALLLFALDSGYPQAILLQWTIALVGCIAAVVLWRSCRYGRVP